MKSMFKSSWFLLSCILLLMLAACGSGETSGSTTAPSSTADTQKETSAAPTAAASTSDWPKTVKHALGTAELKEAPKKVVVLEYTYAEDLLALGVQPAGVADIKGFQSYVNIDVPLSSETVDVGTRQEPNLEAIAALKPDLIITADFRAASNYDSLNSIAPTVAFHPYMEESESNNDQYAEMVETFKTIANLLGKDAEADKVLADLQSTYDADKAKLEAAGKAGAEFAMTDVYTNQNAAELRVFADNSMAVKIIENVGLKNAFHSSKYEVYGYSLGSVELLTSTPNANLFYLIYEGDDVFDKLLKNNPVWKGLPFVKENRTYRLPSDTWPFGGPLSAAAMANQVTDLLVNGAAK